MTQARNTRIPCIAANAGQRIRPCAPLTLALVCAVAAAAHAQDAQNLASYVGFDELRVLPIGEGCGPAVAADFNNDGRTDLAIANNRLSRVELHTARAEPRTEAQRRREGRINELPPSPWFDAARVGVPNRVRALIALDTNNDSRLDLVYTASDPAEIVVLAQKPDASFDVAQRLKVRGLSASPRALALAGAGPDRELLIVVEGKLHRVAIDQQGRLLEPAMLGGSNLNAVQADDLDGDGIDDILAVASDDTSPLRVWLRRPDRSLGAELRLGSQPIVTASTLRFPGRSAAAIAWIERSTRRMVFADLVAAADAPASTTQASAVAREVNASIYALPGGAVRDRTVALAALGAPNANEAPLRLVTFDQASSATLVFPVLSDGRLGTPAAYPTLRTPKQIDAGPWNAGAHAVFVLSDKERAVGVSQWSGGRLTFPEPAMLQTPGVTPVAMARFDVASQPRLAVVAKDRRDYVVELVDPDGVSRAKPLALRTLRRDPQAILPLDIEADGRIELLLLTPGEPMSVVRIEDAQGQPTPTKELGKDDMPQFGLVEAAGPANAVAFDIDPPAAEPPHAELLIADGNVVRACRFDQTRGWRVAEQLFLNEPGTQFTALAARPDNADPRLLAWDKGLSRLVEFARDADGRWSVRRKLDLAGIDILRLLDHPASTSSTRAIDAALALAEDALAVVRLGGSAWSLDEFASFRPEDDDRFEHDMVFGDINADTHTDAVVLDAQERMCSIYSFSAARKLVPATEFEVYQSRLFTGGLARQFEPRQSIIADLTGDRLSDLALIIHDRVLIYPQASPR